MYLREVNDYEKLYSLDVLGVEDRGENDQFDVLRDFKENIAMGGMKSISPGFQELSYQAQTRC